VLLWPPPVRLVDLFVDENQAAVRSLAGTNWQVYTETLASFLQGWEPHPDLPYARFIRESIDQADYLRTLAAWREWDATPYLPNVSCPSLVVSGGSNSKHARMYAAAIPGARFTTLPGAPHMLFIEQPEAVARVIGDFLAGL